MMKKPIVGKRIFVLDTNVLMHDPTSLLRFKEHDICLPLVVLEELDTSKRGLSEIARNVRQASRIINELLEDASDAEMTDGLKLSSLTKEIEPGLNPSGKLFFYTDNISVKEFPMLKNPKADNKILATVFILQKKFPETTVTLVSKDINLRIKASALGLHSEDYFNDRAIEDIRQLRHGIHELPKNFWETHAEGLQSWQEKSRTYYRISGPEVANWFPNDCLYNSNEPGFNAIVRKLDGVTAVIELTHDYMQSKHAVWGITARNIEQNFTLNLLMDPSIDFVTLQGSAGSGKTLLTLAAGLAQTLEKNRYREIVMTRTTVPVGEDIGFLPGTEEEKMTPWMGALMDNLEVLASSEEGGEWGRSATKDLLFNRIKIRSLNFMRGRTFLNKYIIIDEAQNLTPKQMKTLITRAGPNTKIICLGDLSQIDTPYLSPTTSGLTYAIDRFKQWNHSGHITLTRGERSRLADFAAMSL